MLLPALNNARDRARNAACRQWDGPAAEWNALASRPPGDWGIFRCPSSTVYLDESTNPDQWHARDKPTSPYGRSDGTDYGCNVFLLDNYHNNDGLSQYPCFRHVPITVFAEPSNLSEVYLVGDSLGEWDVPNLVPVSSIVDVNVRGPAMRHGSKWNVLFYDLHVGEGGENGSIQPNPYVPGPP